MGLTRKQTEFYYFWLDMFFASLSTGPGGDMQWCFSQVKGAIDDDVAEGMSSAKKEMFISVNHRWWNCTKCYLAI